MKNDATPESLLSGQIALCSVALAECLDGARAARAEDRGLRTKSEMDSAVALLNAAARLGAALARIKGDIRQTIRVEREGAPPGEGSNGRPNG